MLDLRRLRAIHGVVTTGSVHGAAAQLGYTASAVSQHIASLERETGSVLLERAGRGVRPTAAGQLLASHATALLERLAEAEAALEALKAGDLGVLRLASFATAGATLVPPALASVRSDLPNLEVDLRVAERDETLLMLRQGKLDVAIVEFHEGPYPAASLDGISVTHLLSDPYRVVLPRTHRLARRRVLKLSELADEAWVDVVCSLGCCREVTDGAYADAGFVPRRSIEADEYWPAQGFVAAGLGVALIPTLALGVLHEGVVVRNLEPRREPVRQVYGVTRDSVADTVPVRTMIAALQAAADAHRPIGGRVKAGAAL